MITRLVSTTKDGKKEWYQVKYEKLPTFCGNCGLLCHWHEECGDDVHDEATLEWGFIFMDGPCGRCRDRGGRGSEGGHTPFMGKGGGTSGSGFGEYQFDGETDHFAGTGGRLERGQRKTPTQGVSGRTHVWFAVFQLFFCPLLKRKYYH